MAAWRLVIYVNYVKHIIVLRLALSVVQGQFIPAHVAVEDMNSSDSESEQDDLASDEDMASGSSEMDDD